MKRGFNHYNYLSVSATLQMKQCAINEIAWLSKYMRQIVYSIYSPIPPKYMSLWLSKPVQGTLFSGKPLRQWNTGFLLSGLFGCPFLICVYLWLFRKNWHDDKNSRAKKSGSACSVTHESKPIYRKGRLTWIMEWTKGKFWESFNVWVIYSSSTFLIQGE